MSGNGNSRTHHGPEGPFREGFAIPPTLFDEIGSIDEASLRQCIDFCINAGTHEIAGLANASETIALTDAERLRVTEILVDQAANRVPVITGVSGVSTAASVLYARRAVVAGADAVIAMPPYVKHPPSDEILDFYSNVAHASGGLPVRSQNYMAPIGTRGCHQAS